MLSDAVSATKLAQEFYGMLNAGECQSERAESRRLARHGIDEARLREELFYLRAFAVYYSMCVTLGSSPMGTALRTAFMGIWDEAARVDPEKMDAYNAFFRRIHLYAEAANAGSCETGELVDRISRTFARLLDAGKDPLLQELFAACASECFGRASGSAAQALKQKANGTRGLLH